MKRFGLSLALLLIFSAASFAQKSQTYTLTVAPAPCAISITTTALPNAQASLPYSTQLQSTFTGGCALPLVWTASAAAGQTGLPSGLTLSASGLLSGTIPATYCSGTTCPAATFTVTVADSNGVGKTKADVQQ